MVPSVGSGNHLKRFGRRIFRSRPLVSSIFGTIVAVVFAGGITIGSGIATQLPVETNSRQVAADFAYPPNVDGAGAPAEADPLSRRVDTAKQRAPELAAAAQARATSPVSAAAAKPAGAPPASQTPPAAAAPAPAIQSQPAAAAATTAPAKPAEPAKPAATNVPPPAPAKPATSDLDSGIRSSDTAKPTPIKPGSTSEREASTSNSSTAPPSTNPPTTGSSGAARSEAPTSIADLSSTPSDALSSVEPAGADLLNKNVRGKVEPAGPGDPIAANSSIPRPGITGNVIGIIDNTVIVQTRIGATVLVQLDPNTLIRRRGRPAKASEILVGEPIVAIGRVNANRGRLNAVVVAVDPPQPFRSAGAPN